MNQSENKKKSILMWLIMTVSCVSSIVLGTYGKAVLIRNAVLCAVCAAVFFIFRKRFDACYITKKDVHFHIISGFICLSEMNFAYKYWHAANHIEAIAEYFGMNCEAFAAVLAAVLALLSYYFVCYAVKYTAEELLELNREKLSGLKPCIKPVLILSAIYILAALTIFRANYVYKDDMQRIVSGITVYTRESRTLAEFALAFLETDFYFADISPLTQILELVLMAASAVIAFVSFTGRKKISFMDITAMIPFGLSPYFLECISFKYDPPQHGLAVVLALLPLLFSSLNEKKYIAATALCIMMSCASHQVAMTLFPAAVIIIVLIRWNKENAEFRELLGFIKSSATGYIIGLAAYRILIMHRIEYSEGLSTMLPFKELIPGMIRNYKDFYSLVLSQYKPLWLVFILILCISFYLQFSLRSVRKRSAAFGVNLAGTVLLLLLANSLYPLLQEPLHSPRHMYSFGLFIGMIIIAAVSVYDNGPVISKVCASLLAGCFVIYTVKYGNLLSYQADYTRFRTEMVVEELSSMDVIKNSDDVMVQITGSTGYSPAVNALPESDSLMRNLVTTSFDECFGTWSASGFYNLYGLNVHYYVDDEPDLRTKNLPLVKENYYYNLYSDGESILVELKEKSDAIWTRRGE